MSKRTTLGLVSGLCGLLLASPLPGAAAELPDVAIPASVVSRPLSEAPRAEPDADGNYIVDVLILVTPRAEDRLGGARAARELAARLIALANRYFDNSLMPVRYRLASVARSGVTSEDTSYLQNQADLAASAQVRGLRNSSNADLVALLRTSDGDSACGLGGLFNGGERSDPPTNVDPERDAFAVVGATSAESGINCGDVEHLFAHELGHSMGGGHQSALTNVYIYDGGQVALGAYWKPYAHATYCGFASGGLRNNTVMAGGVAVNRNYLQGGDLRGDYYSNPALTVDGLPCGVGPIGATEAETDNARSISEAAPYVAAYRQAPGSKSSERPVAGAWSGLMLALAGLAALGRARRRTAAIS